MVKYIIYFTSLCMKISPLPEVLTVFLCTSSSFWVMILFITDFLMRSGTSNFQEKLLICHGVIKCQHRAELCTQTKLN